MDLNQTADRCATNAPRWFPHLYADDVGVDARRADFVFAAAAKTGEAIAAIREADGVFVDQSDDPTIADSLAGALTYLLCLRGDLGGQRMTLSDICSDGQTTQRWALHLHVQIAKMVEAFYDSGDVDVEWRVRRCLLSVFTLADSLGVDMVEAFENVTVDA